MYLLSFRFLEGSNRGVSLLIWALLFSHVGELNPWVGKIPWRKKWQPTPVFFPGKSNGQRSLVGCSPWGHEESDTAEQLPFHFSLSCIGEGNGNPLQCSCLENPMDGGAWWATVHGAAKSRTRLSNFTFTFTFITLSFRSFPFSKHFLCVDYTSLERVTKNTLKQTFL